MTYKSKEEARAYRKAYYLKNKKRLLAKAKIRHAKPENIAMRKDRY